MSRTYPRLTTVVGRLPVATVSVVMLNAPRIPIYEYVLASECHSQPTCEYGAPAGEMSWGFRKRPGFGAAPNCAAASMSMRRRPEPSLQTFNFTLVADALHM